jgi:hypothetical protein
LHKVFRLPLAALAHAQVCVRLQTLHSACRCLKFGRGPADLLALSEHSDLCHLVDARAFHERQVSAPI